MWWRFGARNPPYWASREVVGFGEPVGWQPGPDVRQRGSPEGLPRRNYCSSANRGGWRRCAVAPHALILLEPGAVELLTLLGLAVLALLATAGHHAARARTAGTGTGPAACAGPAGTRTAGAGLPGAEAGVDRAGVDQAASARTATAERGARSRHAAAEAAEAARTGRTHADTAGTTGCRRGADPADA